MLSFLRQAKHLPTLATLFTVVLFAVFGGLTGLALAQAAPTSAVSLAEAAISPALPASAESAFQQGDDPSQRCMACHQDVVNTWKNSPHHKAYSDEVFQKNWDAQDKKPACLECHTTGFSPATETYESEGVSCVACHGKVASDHPKTPVDLNIANNACRNCHLVTFAEFRASLHEAKGLTCTTCHYAHENGLRLGDQVKQCLNCHGNQLTDFAHVSHVNAGLKCRHCHGYVEPGLEVPVDGLVPTGHDFRESVRACVDCHKGMKFVPVTVTESAAVAPEGPLESGSQKAVEIAELHAQIDTLDQQSRNLTITGGLYGGIGGLVIGGAVAWFIARRSGKSA